MKVNLERTFPMPAPAPQAWELLQDVERVALCMPGARISERTDARHYKGSVAVRFGPASLSFRGEVEVVSIEPASRTLHLIGKGTDTSGGSGASLDLTARVDAVDAASSNLVGKSEVSMSGKAAAFGARMAEAVAEQVLTQFGTNFATELGSRQAWGATAAGEAEGAPAAAAAAPPPRVAELNGLALLWGVVRGWLRAIVGWRRA
ncbi:MAG TPA: SRPBCC family protein [Steroidobacteraceae bacterium]|nr:SRPBCC family protein [Steroidobacteraceae bacterium]